MKRKLSSLLFNKQPIQNDLFLQGIVGKRRMKDKDGDRIPDLFDCVPNDPNRHAPIIPQALQPTAPQTLQKPQTVAQQTQQTIISQAPPGAVTKSDVEAKLKELNQKLENFEQEREEARKKATSYLQPGENWGKSQRYSFNQYWLKREAELKNQATAVSQLRDRIGSGYIPKSQFQDYIKGAKEEGARYVEVSERREVQRARERDKPIIQMGEIPQTMATRSGTYAVYSSGERQKISDYSIKQPTGDLIPQIKKKEDTFDYSTRIEPYRSEDYKGIGFIEAGKQTYFNILRRIQGKREPFEEGTFAPITKAGSTLAERTPKLQDDSFRKITGGDVRMNTIFGGLPSTPSQKLGELKGNIQFKIEEIKKNQDLEPYLNVPLEVAERQLAQTISSTTNQILNQKYQQLVNSGEMTLEQAEESFNREFEKIAEESYNEESTRLRKIKKIYDELQTTSGETGLGVGKFIGETAFTLGVGYATGGVGLAGLGALKLSKGYEKGTLKYEDIMDGVRYPDVKVNKDIIEGTLLIGAGGLGTLSKMRGVEKSIVLDELEALKKQQVRFVELIKTGDKGEYIFKGIQEYNGLKNEIVVKGTIKKIGNKLFFTSGKGSAKLTGETSWNLLGTGRTGTNIISRTDFVVKSGGISFALEETGTYTAGIGIGGLQPTQSMGLIYESKKGAEPILTRFGLRFPSGKITERLTKEGKALVKSYNIFGEPIVEPGASFSRKVTKDLFLTYSGKPTQISLTTSPFTGDISGDITGFGITKVISGAESGAEKGYSVFRGLGGKITKEVGEEVLEKQTQQTFGGLITSNLAKRGLEKPVETIIKQVSATKTPNIFSGIIGGISSSVSKETRSEITPGNLIFSGGLEESRIKKDTKTRILSPTITRESNKREMKSDLIIPNILSTEGLTDRTRITPTTSQIPRLTQAPKMQQEPTFGGMPGIFTPQIPIPPTTPTGIPRIGYVSFPGEKSFIQDERVGYQGYVRERGKIKKITDKPHTRSGALDKIARYVDKNLSAGGYIKPIKQKKTKRGKVIEINKVFQKPLEGGDGYFNQNSYKFRQYVQRKGKIIQTPNRIIEKQAYRLDSKNEVSKIQKEKRISSLIFGGNRSNKKKKGGFRL